MTTTRLLVSVRSAAEAADALAGGAELIDVKEPNAGPLGPASPQTVAQVLAAVRNRAPISVALGELRCFKQNLATNLSGVRYAKLGLAGCGGWIDWPTAWRQAITNFPPTCEPVAVVYADWRAAQAPKPEEILDEAEQAACRFVLVDTFDKSRGGLLAHWSAERLAEFANRVHRGGMSLVLAGSLQLADLSQVVAYQPAYVAVRGAVCRRGRTASLDRFLVEAMSARLASLSRAVLAQPSRPGQSQREIVSF